MIGSPSNLELLLHCYYSSEPHPRFGVPAIQEGLRYLKQHGMIKLVHSQVYDTTQKGTAYIDYLMKVPFPEQHWIVPGDTLDG